MIQYDLAMRNRAPLVDLQNPYPQKKAPLGNRDPESADSKQCSTRKSKEFSMKNPARPSEKLPLPRIRLRLWFRSPMPVPKRAGGPMQTPSGYQKPTLTDSTRGCLSRRMVKCAKNLPRMSQQFARVSRRNAENLLRICQECVTNVSTKCQKCQECAMNAPGMCQNNAPRMCQQRVKNVQRMCRECAKGVPSMRVPRKQAHNVSIMRRVCVKNAPRICQECVKIVPRARRELGYSRDPKLPAWPITFARVSWVTALVSTPPKAIPDEDFL